MAQDLVTGTIIFGCGGHGRSVADIILLNDPATYLLFVDEAANENERIWGFDVLREIPSGTDYSCIAATGDNYGRKILVERILTMDHLKIISVISKTAHIGHDAQIGDGCFIGNYCHVGPESIIGANTILNNACVVDHEVRIGGYCHIGPNATISGRSTIGDLVFIGVGATVIDKSNISPHVIIGAGSTVIGDIKEPGTYVGTPARRIK
jgi:UDP-N-acetylbacillosamine N-acetyltransferase